jgi:hypothetical protein
MKLLNIVAELGGADPSDPLEPNSRQRHLSTGGLLVCLFVFWWISATALLRTDFHEAWPAAVSLGLLVSGILFQLDQAILSTPLREDTASARLRLFLGRGILSVAIGAVFSLSILLVMFHDATAPIVAASNQAAARAATQQITHHSVWSAAMASDQAIVNKDNNQITGDTEMLGKSGTELNNLQSQWSDETVCTHGGDAENGDLCGIGPKSATLKHTLDSYVQLIQAKTAEVKSDQAAVLTLNGEISTDRNKLDAEIRSGTAAALNNTGLVAQGEALVPLLWKDKASWPWPALLIVLDLSIVFIKTAFPESNFDRSRRRTRELDDQVHGTFAGSPEWNEAATAARRSLADVAIMRNNVEADQQIAAITARAARIQKAREKAEESPDSRPERVGRSWRLPRPNRGIRRVVGAVGAVAVVAALVALPNLHTMVVGDSSANQTIFGSGGHPINLKDGETLTIPVGAITGNKIVTAAYTTGTPWPDNSPASRQVTFSTSGKIVGKPVLSLKVAANETAAARDGALQLAYWSPSADAWTAYQETSYNPKTHTISAVLPHFSTWRFWTSDFSSELTAIGQAAGQWEGRRATTALDCGGNSTPPGWVRGSTGISNKAALPVRACLTTQPGSDVLDVELVNNRPYGLMLRFGSAKVKWARHDSADTLVDGLRDAVGDAAARVDQGLYLPPLSSASIGIADSGLARKLTFTIAPTRGTILADALDMSLGPLIKKGTTAVAMTWGREVFAEAAGSCAQFLSTFPVTSVPDASTVMSVLTSAAPECIKNVLTVAASSGLAADAGVTGGTATVITAASDTLEKIINVGQWADIEDKLGKVLDFSLDQAFAVASDLGFGFGILAA